ncbi:MAG TPA: hypothetical protein VFR78_06070 [Pyrinomonadaceae bacterium]|nr:hypothetical protein [Pyrinomonadaceae bacterium]
MPADVFEIFDWIIDGFAGWRYVFSRSFRKRTHARWRVEGWGTAFVEILFGGIGVLLTVVVVWVLVALLTG